MKSPYNPTDQQWMRYALALAASGEGFVEPNPMVGCVILKDGEPVGEGYHTRFGCPHAEREALASVPDGMDLTGTTWYVTLEPCCHSGKTPPCTDAVLEARPSRVVVAARDPFPEVAGRGIEQLRQAGIEVEVGVCEEEANRLNAPYLKRVQSRRPWVIAKWAMTLDGKIATSSGDSKWISNDASRADAHRLRARVDGIVVGIGTVLADDPMLNARVVADNKILDETKVPRVATRIVIDPQARTPIDSKIVTSSDDIPVMIVTYQDADADKKKALKSQGCEVFQVDAKSEGSHVKVVHDLMDHCYQAGMTNLMLEGGGATIGHFFDAGEIDAYQIYMASKLIGGQGASPVKGLGVDRIADSPMLEPLQVEAIEGDLMLKTRKRSGW